MNNPAKSGPDGIRGLCILLEQDHGRDAIANKLGITPQAVGQALRSYQSWKRYLDLRVKMLEAYGHQVDGPFFEITTPAQSS
jgi:hypothetical protein